RNADGIEKACRRTLALRQIAIDQAKAGLRDAADKTLRQALEATNRLENPREKSQAMMQFARAQLYINDIKGAIETAKSMGKVGQNILLFREIAMAQVKAGDIKGALETASYASSSPGEKSNILQMIVTERLYADDIHTAYGS